MDKQFYNLTNPQKNIWNMEQYYKGTAVNNVGGTAYFNTPLNFCKFKETIFNVLQKNDVFHLKLSVKEGIVNQSFDTPINYNIEIIDINDISELSAIEKDMCETAFCLETDLLFKLKIFRLPNNFGGFIVVMHHLISDSWSIGLFCRKITQDYVNLIHSYPIADVNYSYTNFIKQEQEYLNSPSFEKDEKYWNNLFETIPEVATIPGSFKKISAEAYCSADRQIYNIPQSIIKKLSNFCKDNKISLYNFFMSVFSIYISRVSNLDDFVIGTPILNRSNFNDKNTNGMFVSTVPLRIRMQNDSSFINFSKDIAQRCMSMLRHQRYPYQKILETVRKADSKLPNLYNIVLSYQITNTTNENIDCETHWIFNGNSADDLQIHITDYNNTGSLNILYDYKTSKYSKKDISDVHTRICHIIEQILDNNNILVNDIDIVTEKEKHQLLYEFNDTASDYPRDKTIIELFEEQVAKVPDNTAVVFEGHSLTYKELNEKSNQLAKFLIKNNISNSFVAVYMHKSISYIISILGILKSNNAILPISSEYPQNRVNYMIEDSKCPIVIGEQRLLDNLNTGIFKLNIEDFTFSDISSETIFTKTNSSNLAYLIYTSGTTGKPKAVGVSNKALVNHIFRNSK